MICINKPNQALDWRNSFSSGLSDIKVYEWTSLTNQDFQTHIQKWHVTVVSAALPTMVSGSICAASHTLPGQLLSSEPPRIHSSVWSGVRKCLQCLHAAKSCSRVGCTESVNRMGKSTRSHHKTIKCYSDLNLYTGPLQVLISKVTSYSVVRMLPPFSWEKVNGQKSRATVDCQSLTDTATASSKAEKCQ